MIAEDELSADAQAILAYARHWGEPFTRIEIVGVAPGAAWDPFAPWPRTMAKPDPIRELMRAGLVELLEERRSNGGKHGGHPYKVYRLTDGPRSLADLLDMVVEIVHDGLDGLDEVRTEILERFGKP